MNQKPVNDTEKTWTAQGLVSKASRDGEDMAREMIENLASKIDSAKTEEEKLFFIWKMFFFISMMLKNMAHISSEKTLMVCEKACEMIKLGQKEGVF